MKPGHVVEEHERDAERVAQPHEARRLVGRVHVERAAEHHRLVGDDADRLAADRAPARSRGSSPTPASSRRTSPSSTTAVDDLAHVVRAAGRGRHDVVELLDAPVDGIGRRTDAAAPRGCAAGRTRGTARTMREALARRRRPRGRRRREILVCTAEPPISSSVTSSPDRRLHEVAAAERHRRRALHHRHEVGQRGDVRGAGRAVAEHRRDHAARRRSSRPARGTARPRPANVEPLVDWMRAPAESSSHTIGMRWRSASVAHARGLVSRRPRPSSRPSP